MSESERVSPAASRRVADRGHSAEAAAPEAPGQLSARRKEPKRLWRWDSAPSEASAPSDRGRGYAGPALGVFRRFGSFRQGAWRLWADLGILRG